MWCASLHAKFYGIGTYNSLSSAGLVRYESVSVLYSVIAVPYAVTLPVAGKAAVDRRLVPVFKGYLTRSSYV